jgi:hypothetical protein
LRRWTDIIDDASIGFAPGTLESISSTLDASPHSRESEEKITQSDQACHQGPRKTGLAGFSLLPSGQQAFEF